MNIEDLPSGHVWWLMSVIAAACKAETGGSQIQGQPVQLTDTLFQD